MGDPDPPASPGHALAPMTQNCGNALTGRSPATFARSRSPEPGRHRSARDDRAARRAPELAHRSAGADRAARWVTLDPPASPGHALAPMTQNCGNALTGRSPATSARSKVPGAGPRRSAGADRTQLDGCRPNALTGRRRPRPHAARSPEPGRTDPPVSARGTVRRRR